MRESTEAQKRVFKLYKGNNPFLNQLCFADYVNESLGKGRALPDAWEEQATELDALIRDSLLTSATHLYRAMPDAYLAPHIRGDEFLYPAYMSTAADEYAIRRHFSSPFRGLAAAKLCIECGVGTPALDMEADANFGGMEQEFLLPRGSTFRVDGIEEVTDPVRMSELMTTLYAKNYSMLKIYRLRFLA
jgi:hypothetical protein